MNRAPRDAALSLHADAGMTPALPTDRELRIYYRLWLGEQAVVTGERPSTSFHQWRREWIRDQPKHLAELRRARLPVQGDAPREDAT